MPLHVQPFPVKEDVQQQQQQQQQQQEKQREILSLQQPPRLGQWRCVAADITKWILRIYHSPENSSSNSSSSNSSNSSSSSPAERAREVAIAAGFPVYEAFAADATSTLIVFDLQQQQQQQQQQKQQKPLQDWLGHPWRFASKDRRFFISRGFSSSPTRPADDQLHCTTIQSPPKLFLLRVCTLILMSSSLFSLCLSLSVSLSVSLCLCLSLSVSLSLSLCLSLSISLSLSVSLSLSLSLSVSLCLSLPLSLPLSLSLYSHPTSTMRLCVASYWLLLKNPSDGEVSVGLLDSFLPASLPLLANTKLQRIPSSQQSRHQEACSQVSVPDHSQLLLRLYLCGCCCSGGLL